MDLEVCLGPERRSVGIAFDNSSSREEMRASRRTLAELCASGLFSPQREIFFAFEFHFRTAEDWSTFLERPRAGGVEADQGLLDMAFSAPSHGGGIVATEKVVASAYHSETNATIPPRP